MHTERAGVFTHLVFFELKSVKFRLREQRGVKEKGRRREGGARRFLIETEARGRAVAAKKW